MKHPLWGAVCCFLLVATHEFQSRPVNVVLAPRGEDSQPYWSGQFKTLAFEDGEFFKQTVLNQHLTPPRPFPERSPPYRVTFRAFLQTPAEGNYTFELDSNWKAALDIDTNRVFGTAPFQPGQAKTGTIALSAGVHEITLQAQPSMDGAFSPLRVLWKPPGEPLQTLNAVDFVDNNPSAIKSLLSYYSWLPWVLGLFLGGIVFHWVLNIQAKGTVKQVVFGALILGLFSLGLRGVNSTTYPRLMIDELHNTWAGIHLIDEGTPRSWSFLPPAAYGEKTTTRWHSFDYPMVDAAFDHTPLLLFLLGAEAKLLGADTMFDATLPRIRPIMVLIGAMSVVFLFLAAREVVSFRTAFLAGVILCISPLAAFNGRLAKEDCLVQLFAVMALYVFLLHRRFKHPHMDWIVGLLGGLAALTKVMGISMGIAFALAAIAESGGIRRAMKITASSFAVAAIYPLYGFLIDADTFVKVMTHMSTGYSFETFADKVEIFTKMISQMRLSSSIPLVDGWMLLGWLAAFRYLRDPAITVPFVAYQIVLAVTVRSLSFWGFYTVPILPFLALAAATLVEQVLLKREFLSVFLFVGLFFLPSLVYTGGFPVPGGFRGLLLLSCLPLLPALFSHIPACNKLRDKSVIMLSAMLVIAIVSNAGRLIGTS